MAVRFEFNEDRVVASVVFLASRGLPGLTKYTICKLLVLADKLHLVRFGRPITGDEIYAIENGPIPSRTLNALTAFTVENFTDPTAQRLSEFVDLDKSFRYPRFSARELDFEENLSRSELAALTEVASKYGRMDFGELKAITHELPAYQKAWAARLETERRHLMRFEDFFDEDADAIVGAYEEMIENDKIANGRPAF